MIGQTLYSLRWPLDHFHVLSFLPLTLISDKPDSCYIDQKQSICVSYYTCFLFTLMSTNSAEWNQHNKQKHQEFLICRLSFIIMSHRAKNASWGRWATRRFDYWRVIQKTEYTGSRGTLTSPERLSSIVTSGSCVLFQTQSSKSSIPNYFYINDRRESTTVVHPKTKNYVEEVFIIGQKFWFLKKY